MKFKSILTFIVSTLLLAGCSEDQVLGTFGDLNLSTTYVSIPAEGGDVKVTLNAGEAWEFSAEKDFAIPEWITVSQTSGEAGKTELTFSAEASNLGREAEMKIIAGAKNQFLKVRQGEMTASEATCKAVNEAPDGKNFTVTGTITKIENTTYGNWYMNDGTADLYIYGTLDAEGKTKNFASLGLEVGDKVTIEGPKSTHKEKAQMVDVTVKKIEKALLKIVSPSTVISKEGGILEIKIASKGKGTFFSIADECQDWISYNKAEYINGVPTKLEPTPADTVIYTFNIAPYNDGARKGSISFYANEGAPISYTFLQGIADVTVKEFIDANVDNAIQYRIVGHVTRFNKYNNNFYLKDYTGEVYAYYVDTQGIKDIAIGDFVTVVGKRSEYNGEPQLPKGTLLEKYTASPEVSVAEFLTKEDSKEVYYKLTGTITKIKDALYGNVYLQDANGDIVYVYGLLSGYGATESADKQGLVEEKGLKEGDTITIVGNKASHKGSPQVGNAVYMSHTSK